MHCLGIDVIGAMVGDPTFSLFNLNRYFYICSNIRWFVLVHGYLTSQLCVLFFFCFLNIRPTLCTSFPSLRCNNREIEDISEKFIFTLYVNSCSGLTL